SAWSLPGSLTRQLPLTDLLDPATSFVVIGTSTRSASDLAWNPRIQSLDRCQDCLNRRDCLVNLCIADDQWRDHPNCSRTGIIEYEPALERFRYHLAGNVGRQVECEH